MAEVVWAVPAVQRKKNPNLRYHLYRKRLTDNYNVYYEKLCKRKNASERRVLYRWADPPKKRRCMACQDFLEAVLECE